MEQTSLKQVLYRILEVQEEILLQLKDRRGVPLNPVSNSEQFSNLVDKVDVKSFLKISDSTLYRITKSNLLTTVRVGRRDYYNLSEIKKLALRFSK